MKFTKEFNAIQEAMQKEIDKKNELYKENNKLRDNRDFAFKRLCEVKEENKELKETIKNLTDFIENSQKKTIAIIKAQQEMMEAEREVQDAMKDCIPFKHKACFPSEEQLKRFCDAARKDLIDDEDHEIKDIEDELNEASSSNEYNPVVKHYGWDPHHEEPWDRFENLVGDEPDTEELDISVLLTDWNGDLVSISKKDVLNYSFTSKGEFHSQKVDIRKREGDNVVLDDESEIRDFLEFMIDKRF